MKLNVIKKSMVCALAVSLVMAPVIGAGATESESRRSSVEEAVSAAEAAAAAQAAATAQANAAAYAEATKFISATSSVGSVKSTVNGAFAAKSVDGVAVTTAGTSLAEGYGLAQGEKAYAMVWDLDAKKSNLAQQTIELAAASQGAEVGPALNIELGKKSGGKYSLLSTNGPDIRLSIGVPANFAQADKTFAVVRVRPGGVVTILPDVDDNPNTVTFDTTGGAGAYAVIKY